MFRTVSETRAVKWSNHVKLALPRCGSAGSGRDEPAPPRFLEDKYEIAQKRVGQLTADLGQKEMQLEDLQCQIR